MPVYLAKNSFSLVLWHTLDFVSPLPCQLAGGLSSLHPRVHGEEAIITEQLASKLFKLSQTIVVKCSTCQGQLQ